MRKELPAGSMMMDKRDFMNALSALFTAQISVEDSLRDDTFTVGYQQGFSDALLAVAASVGVVEEFANKAGTIRQLRYRRWRTVPAKR